MDLILPAPPRRTPKQSKKPRTIRKAPRQPENIKNRCSNHKQLFLWFWVKRLLIPFGERNFLLVNFRYWVCCGGGLGRWTARMVFSLIYQWLDRLYSFLCLAANSVHSFFKWEEIRSSVNEFSFWVGSNTVIVENWKKVLLLFKSSENIL